MFNEEKSMVKILFLITDLSYGGAEKVLINLANNMNKQKFDVSIKTIFDIGINRNQICKEVQYLPGFKYQFRGNTQIMKLFSPKYLFNRLVKEEYDLIISFLEGPPSRIVSAYSGKKIAWIHIEQKNIKLASSAFRSSKEAEECYNKFDRVVCVANSIKKDFTDIFNIKVPVDVLYNVNETDLIKKICLEKQNQIKKDNNCYNLISVGRLSFKHKGYDKLVRIHKKLIENGINNKLYILGEGQDRENLISMIKKLSVENSCFLLGFDKNPYKYVKAADLFICSSNHEGFSTAVSESLIVGTPVVSTLVSGAEELLGDNNQYGIVCENNEESLYDAVFDLLSNSKKLEHYKKQAEMRGDMFSKNKTVKAVENYIEELVNEK